MITRKEWADARELADIEWARALKTWNETRHLDENVAWTLVSAQWEQYVHRVNSSPMPD